MAQYWVGLDLLDLQRFRLALRRSGTGFVDRIASREERLGDHMAGVDPETAMGLRFGLKEGVIKAIGGFPAGTGFHDIHIAIEAGEPRLSFRGKLVGWACEREVQILATRVASSGDLALASVVLYGKREPKEGSPHDQHAGSI